MKKLIFIICLLVTNITYLFSCPNYTGTFFFEYCGGELYYFIELEDGRIFDPYFADDVSFTPYEGQVVTFDYIANNTITTPCTISEAPITITCIKEYRAFVFEAYPWLSNVLNVNNCSGETVKVYDAGAFDFIAIESASDLDLYYQDGTFYCSDAPGFSCISAYNLNNVADIWTCGDPVETITGCTDANALNYNSAATEDDGSCINAGNCANYSGTFFFEDCDGSSYYFIRMSNGQVFDPYFAEGISFNPTEGQTVNLDYQLNTNVTTPCSVSEAAITITCLEVLNNFSFEEYPWLSNFIDINNCSDESIQVYDAGSYNFVSIESSSGTDLYFQDGTYYCSDRPEFSCATVYGLTNMTDSWACGDVAGAISGCTDPNALNYNAAASEDDGSCINAGNCANYTGTFFFEDCGGSEYFFIRLTDGRVFDPYFVEGVSFDIVEGQTINFDYQVNNAITTPCTVSEAAITITCIEAISNFSFDGYPWLSNLININNCNGESIFVYDAGSYNFVSIESSTGTDLYFQDGTYYCSDRPGFSCVAAYGLTNLADSWTCGDVPIAQVPGCTDPTATNYNASADTDDGSCTYQPSVEFDFTAYPWLNDLVNPINCTNQVEVTEYDFVSYAFIYIKTNNGGSLYLNNGTFYCSDTDGVGCLNSYSLTNAATTWSCAGGGFQRYPLRTTTYTSITPSVTLGSSGCGPQGPAGPSTSTSFLVIVEQCPPAKTGAIEKEQKLTAPTFNIYPNPTSNIVFIDLPGKKEYQIRLMDISGKVMKQTETNLNEQLIEINVNDLPKGMYLVELKNEQSTNIQKLIIE